MQHIPDQKKTPTLQGLDRCMLRIKVVRQGVEVQKPLAGMAVKTITTVEDHRALAGGLKCFRKLLRNTRALMADHQNISTHRNVSAGRVQQRLTLAE